MAETIKMGSQVASKGRVGPILLGVVLLGWVALRFSQSDISEGGHPVQPSSTGPRTAQAPLSPQGVQTLNTVLGCGLSGYEQQLVRTAIIHLGKRAEEYLSRGTLAQVARVQPDYLCGQFRILSGILVDLPSDYHQAFVDGYFQVAPALEQFTQEVLQLYVRQGQVTSILFARGQVIRECMGLINTIAMDPNGTWYVHLPPACR